jgi:hypothetical protein
MEPGPKFELKYLKGSVETFATRDLPRAEATQISRFHVCWKDPADVPNPVLACQCCARKENFHGILKHGFKKKWLLKPLLIDLGALRVGGGAQNQKLWTV